MIESATTAGGDVLLKYSATVEVIERDVIERISKAIADRWVTEHYQEVAARISQDAVALLSVAEAGAKIRESLEKKLPDKIVEIARTKTEMYQRGVFGSITRIR